MTLNRALKVLAVIAFLVAFFVAASWVDTDEAALQPIALLALGFTFSTLAETV